MAKVDMESLKPNSYKYKEEMAVAESESKEREKLKPVVGSDQVVSTKKSLGRKFAETFLGENLKDVSKYLIWDVIIPGMKNAILDTMSMMFFGETSGRRSGGRRDSDRTSYSSYYRGTNRSSREKRERDRYDRDEDRKVDYRNIVLKYRQDAEDVVDALYERIEKYGSASVADLLDLVGQMGQYTDNNWGWDRKQDIGIRRVERGFLIDVAPAEYIRE